MHWASSVCKTGDLGYAVEKTAQEIVAELDAQPDLLIVFFSPHFSDQISQLPVLLGRYFGQASVFGCSASGVIGGGREIEHQPVLSLTAACLADVNLRFFHLQQQQVENWRTFIDLRAQEDCAIILLADPLTCNPEPLLNGIDKAFPLSRIVGGLASGADTTHQHQLVLNRAVHRSGLIGVVLSGDIVLDNIVAQGCKPIGEPLFITGSKENRLLTLDGRSPIEILHELYQHLEQNDQALFGHSLFAGLSMHDGRSSYQQGDFLIRNIIGIDQETGAIAIAAIPAPNSIIQFHLRDAQASADDLNQLLTQFADTGKAAHTQGALLFSCLGRGIALYGESDHDSTVFKSLIGPVPLGGFFCNGEIGPVDGKTFLHAYTSSFGLFRKRSHAADQ